MIWNKEKCHYTRIENDAIENDTFKVGRSEVLTNSKKNSKSHVFK